jgi:dTDP-4-amino-4,6-dideoxygalactose transaminase
MPGVNSRLDPLQASILNVKLKYLKVWNDRRVRIASIYNHELKDLSVHLPVIRSHNEPVWHLYCIRSSKRDMLRASLTSMGVDTLIHYPVPPHMQDAYKSSRYHENSFPLAKVIASELVSLPIGPSMNPNQVSYVIDCVKKILR